MNARRLSAWGFVLILAALAVFTLAGNRFLFLLFVPLALFVLAYHFTFLCAKCTNVTCAFNRRSPDFVFRIRRREPEGEPEALSFSDIDSLRQGVLPLAAPIAVGLVGTAQFSLLALIAVLVASALTFLVYSRASCRRCTNNCPNNKNTEYWDWKRQANGAGAGRREQ
ncbi:MAG: hypothetical protein C4521_04315 [Actinobacteria bacterium]|nr:MAG: hypothetical protein C4521_04315 [Actinomycetota bacterium]